MCNLPKVWLDVMSVSLDKVLDFIPHSMAATSCAGLVLEVFWFSGDYSMGWCIISTVILTGIEVMQRGHSLTHSLPNMAG